MPSLKSNFLAVAVRNKPLAGLLAVSGLIVVGVIGWKIREVYWDIRPQHFTTIDGQRHKVVGDRTIPVMVAFREDFESVENFLDLGKNGSGSFNSFVVQSPSTPTVKSYVAQRAGMMRGAGTFIDNTISVSREHAHHGEKSLRLYAVTPTQGIVSKSMVENTLLELRQDEEFWFSAWYYIERGWPLTLVDIETSAMQWGPGPRVTLFSKEEGLGVELKHGLKPTYKQPRGQVVAFPTKRWVHVGVHLKLSAGNDGVIQVWQDGQKIIDRTGRTLPKRSAVLDRIEVGITATDRETVLYVDDVVFQKDYSEAQLLAEGARKQSSPRR